MPAPTATSLIDLVDAHDRPVAVAPRSEALNASANFRVAHALLFDDRGELLLQMLGRDRLRHSLRWGSSVAAYLHAGETYDQGIGRRTQEEVGLTVPLSVVGRWHMRDGASGKFVAVYAAVVEHDQPLIAEPDHIERLRWWTGPELDSALQADPEQFTPTFRFVLERYRGASPPGLPQV